MTDTLLNPPAAPTMVLPPEPGQRFKHLNGQVYKIICLAKDEHNEQLLVIHQGPDGAYWSRTIGNFMGLKFGLPRFTLWGDL